MTGFYYDRKLKMHLALVENVTARINDFCVVAYETKTGDIVLVHEYKNRAIAVRDTRGFGKSRVTVGSEFCVMSKDEYETFEDTLPSRDDLLPRLNAAVDFVRKHMRVQSNDDLVLSLMHSLHINSYTELTSLSR